MPKATVKSKSPKPAATPRRAKRWRIGPLLASRQAHVVVLGAFVVAAGVGAWRTDRVWQEIGFGAGAIGASAMLLLGGLRFAPKVLARHLHRWAGLSALAMAGWGALGFYPGGPGVLSESTLGGRIALDIIDSPDAVGALRLAGLGVVGLGLVAPGVAWGVARWSALAAGVGALGAGRSVWAGLVALARWARDRRSGGEEEATASEGEGTAPPFLDEAEGAHPEETEEEPRREERRAPAGAAPVRRPKHEPNGRPVASGAYRNGEVALEPHESPGGWRLPSIEILDNVPSDAPSPADNEARARRIEEALGSYGIQASVVEINPGPAVTQFGVEPGWQRKFKEVRVRDAEGKQALDEDGKPLLRREEVSRTRVKVDAIANLDRDLALALAAPSIRIEAPIPGKSLVGIEVPNTTSEIVSLRSTLESAGFTKLRAKTKLPLALGKGSGGEPAVADLAKMPHLLIAGATGSGKSVCINAVLACILMTATPRDVRLLLIDPKRVEMVTYNSLPHLITPVIIEVDKVVGALRWAMHEMDERYKRFSSIGARNLEGYNKHRLVVDPLPYLVIAIDELADLMMAAPYDVEHALTRLAQLGRATGIHLVVATQRPSVDVVTGLIKANFPTRISFAVTSLVDSRTILDGAGAEKLLGKGDMLYLPQDAPKPIRIQGVYVSDREIERLVRAWNQQGQPGRPPQITVSAEGAAPPAASSSAPSGPFAPAMAIAEGEEEGDEALLRQARAIAGQNTRLSPSLLSRRLKVGYTKAKRLMEELEAEGYGDAEQEVVR